MNIVQKLSALGAAIAIALALVPASVSAKGAVKMSVEKNTDRPGGDYNAFWMEKPQANMCRQACKNDTRCLAYTYVKPGVQGDQARCWLKNSVPAAVDSDCCESGVKDTKED